jgi:hypothetical protein
MQEIGMRYEGVTNRFYNAELVCYVMTREAFQVKLSE